jgi:hypothetical protein
MKPGKNDRAGGESEDVSLMAVSAWHMECPYMLTLKDYKNLKNPVLNRVTCYRTWMGDEWWLRIRFLGQN